MLSHEGVATSPRSVATIGINDIPHTTAYSTAAPVTDGFAYLLPKMHKARLRFADSEELADFARQMRGQDLHRVRMIAFQGSQGFWEQKTFQTAWFADGEVSLQRLSWKDFIRSSGDRTMLLVQSHALRLVR